MHRSTRLLAGAALSGALVLAAATPAMAFDCYNASRSSTGGTQAAAHSDSWVSIPEALRAFVGLNDAQIAQVMDVVNKDSRIPKGFAIFNKDFELAHAAPTKVTTNYKGIDHSDDNGVLNAIMEDVGIALG